MFYKRFYLWASILVALLTAAMMPASAQHAGAVVDQIQPANGRCTIGGVALAADGKAACALALASGRCMFTCGSGSPRCEGGTANLEFGRFLLTDLPLEADGSVILQVFVQGNISYIKRITGCNDGPDETTRWGAYNSLCCKMSNGQISTITYEVTVDGVTKRSISSSCDANSSTFEGFVITTPGTKSITTHTTSSGCGNSSASGTVSMAVGNCYLFLLTLDNGSRVTKFGKVDCPSSGQAASLLRENVEATPMAILPMLPTVVEDGLEMSKTTDH